ncbi:hypothetical protein [Fuerstiella marisgermanici]|uniref:hypothetical protein n=1 Tax=Fuerstiella marisgermanici TaxID=1891926 RepID=UPI0011AB3EFF|nr:hypothetical protein [Fuerstiella marisgermanici]
MFCCTTAPAVAQPDRLVSLKLEPLSIRGRSSSVIPLQIKLEYNSNQILEGDLVMEVYNSNPTDADLMATIRYEGIVLQGTDYIFNTVLPPFEHSHNQQYMITCWFDTPEGRLSLSRDPDDPAEPHELLSIGAFERATLVCSVSGRRDFLKPSKQRAFLDRSLSLEPYSPNPGPAPAADQQLNRQRILDTQRVQNYACSWNVYELPGDPLHLCAFDIVLLADNSLSRLEDGQMEALLTWVKAGGSLCVLPDDNRLQKPHLLFLQTLFERAEDPDLHLSITDDGNLLVISDEEAPVVNRRFGLGRVTLLPDVEDLPERLSGADLGSVVGHLFKVRSNSEVFDGEQWGQSSLDALLKARGAVVRKDRNGFYLQYKNGRRSSGSYWRATSREDLAAQLGLNYELQPKVNPIAVTAMTTLMPKDVEMVPSYIIALLLFAYVITIGPVDWFVLGFFKARKYTWLLFPIVTAFFTVLTVRIAHNYMASTDTGGRFTIVDLVDDGQPVRQTDLQLHFYASQVTLENETSNSFFVPAQTIAVNQLSLHQPVPQSTYRNVNYHGRFPQAYSHQQRMRQWEPQLNRTFTLSPKADKVPKIPWDDETLVTTTEGRSRLATLLTEIASPNQKVDAVVLNQQGQLPVFKMDGFLFSMQKLASGLGPIEAMQQPGMYGQIYQGFEDQVAIQGILQSSSRSGTQDFFSVVSQVSPQGAGSMEDLPIHDSTDPNQWLLIVAVKEGDETTFYRRVFHVASN